MHNSSAVIRSCEVFGIQDSHLIEARFGKKIDKNIALGAQQWVDTYSYSDSLQCIQALRERGYRIVATTPNRPRPIQISERPRQGLVGTRT